MKGTAHLQFGNHKTRLTHNERVRRKQERFDGLKDLRATYEEAGRRVPAALRTTLNSLQAQLRVMGVDVETYVPEREGKRQFPTTKRVKEAA